MSAPRGQVLEYDYSWLHDDTEEDVVGSDWHQDTIRALAIALRLLAQGRGWPWHVGDQLTVVARRPDGRTWCPAPDIAVFPTLGPGKRRRVLVAAEGPPALVIEVASET